MNRSRAILNNGHPPAVYIHKSPNCPELGITGQITNDRFSHKIAGIGLRVGRESAVGEQQYGKYPAHQSHWSTWEERVNAGSTGMIAIGQCAIRGAGVILQSDWIIGEDPEAGKLVDLFPNHIATPTNFHTSISAVYPDRKYTPKKVTAFADFLQANLNR